MFHRLLFKAFLIPYPAAALTPPKAAALPTAVNAGRANASKGKMPPFWCLVRRLFRVTRVLWRGARFRRVLVAGMVSNDIGL